MPADPHGGAGAKLLAVLADAETVTGFLLAGIGCNSPADGPNYIAVDEETTVQQIEAAFAQLVGRDDVAILLVSTKVASVIRHAIDAYQENAAAQRGGGGARRGGGGEAAKMPTVVMEVDTKQGGAGADGEGKDAMSTLLAKYSGMLGPSDAS